MQKGLYFVLFLLILTFPFLKAQALEEDSEFYLAFGEEWNFSFLKGISHGISQAMKDNNVKALGAYAALLFHAERVSGKQIPELTALDLLEKATQIALINQDQKTLLLLAQLWEESYFGPKNEEIAKNLREENHSIKVLPSFQEIATGDVVLFRVLKNISLINMTEIEIPLDQLNFDVNSGTFWQNEYHAPDRPCHAIVTITHRSTGQKAYAILVVKSQENLSVPYREEEQELEKSRKIESLLFKKSKEKSIEAIKYYAEEPKILQKILSKSEAAKIKAIENLVHTVQKILELFPEILNKQNRSVTLTSESLWAGVRTTDAYIYSGEPYQLRVLASISSDWIIESIYRSFKRKDIDISKPQLEKIKKYLPSEVEEEGAVSLE